MHQFLTLYFLSLLWLPLRLSLFQKQDTIDQMVTNSYSKMYQIPTELTLNGCLWTKFYTPFLFFLTFKVFMCAHNIVDFLKIKKMSEFLFLYSVPSTEQAQNTYLLIYISAKCVTSKFIVLIYGPQLSIHLSIGPFLVALRDVMMQFHSTYIYNSPARLLPQKVTQKHKKRHSELCIPRRTHTAR